jgi:hypothetical protein
MTTYRVEKVQLMRSASAPADARRAAPAKKQRPVQRETLRSLWERACRRYVPAQQELHRRLVADPSLRNQLQAFAMERQLEHMITAKARGVTIKARRPESAWERMAGGSKWISVVEGGLPTLGKRR